MGTYTPEETLMPVGLDELGLRHGLERFPEELLSDYRRRLLLEARDPSDPSGQSLIRHTNRKAGEFELPVFDIELVLDSEDLPVALDPHVEVTSTWLRAYHDHESEALDFEVSLLENKWLEDIVAAFTGSLYFSLTLLDDYDEYLKSNHLRIGNTTKMHSARQLFGSFQNAMPDKHIKEMWFSNLSVFQDLKDTKGQVTESGDYWIDYDEGVVISYDVQAGTAYYRYGEFPHRVYWQPIRVQFANDVDLDYETKNFLVSDETGELEPLLLNSNGGLLWNQVLAAHPLGWGE